MFFFALMSFLNLHLSIIILFNLFYFLIAPFAIHHFLLIQQGTMLFFSFFKSMVGREVVIELKNDLSICGTLHSVDQYLNMKLNDITVTDVERHPHMISVKNCFIRGSVIRYVHLPSEGIDTQLLQEASRKEILQSRQQAAK